MNWECRIASDEVEKKLKSIGSVGEYREDSEFDINRSPLVSALSHPEKLQTSETE